MSNILIGLDIGTNNIKAIQMSKDEKTSGLIAAGFIATPLKDLNLANSQDEEILSNSINRLIHDMKVSTTDVSASLPSSKVITRVVELPLLNDKELSSSIQWEAEQYIPFPLTKVKLDYAVIEKDEQNKKMKILLVAAPLSIIEKYTKIISSSGLNLVSLETEIMAMGRCTVQNLPNIPQVLLISIGASTTEIGILHDQVLIYTKSYPIGGYNMTKAIAQELGFELAQAEEYKKTYGLEEDKLEGKVATILTPYINSIIEEMEKTVLFFKKQYPKNEINTAVVCGAASKLPGLVLNITKNLGLDTQISNPFLNINVDPKILPKLVDDAPIYTIAAGLALKDL